MSQTSREKDSQSGRDSKTRSPKSQSTVENSPPGKNGWVGRQFGRYEIHQLLGRGAFGAVYRAWDTQLEREVALKIPHPGSLENPRVRERFLREAKAAARLQHPNIIPLFDAGKEHGEHYIASSFIVGSPLDTVIQENRPDFRAAAEIVRKLAEGLYHAHRFGIVHRDVKPANIIIDEQGEPHLMDFGLARFEQSEEKLTVDGSVMGTPAYMPIEQADGDLSKVGPASDQYSLGVTLYEMLCGQLPFSGPPHIVIANLKTREPDNPRSIQSEIPTDLETICLKAMGKQSESRYADCGELAKDLQRWMEGRPIDARPLSRVERFVRWCRREPLIASLALTVLLVFAAGASVSIWQWSLADRARAREVGLRENAEAVEKSERRQRIETEKANRRLQEMTARILYRDGLERCEAGNHTYGLLLLTRGLQMVPDSSPQLEQSLRGNIAAWEPLAAQPVGGDWIEDPEEIAKLTSLTQPLQAGIQSPSLRSPSLSAFQKTQFDTYKQMIERTKSRSRKPSPQMLKQMEERLASMAPERILSDDKTLEFIVDQNGFGRVQDAKIGTDISPPLDIIGENPEVIFSPDNRELFVISVSSADTNAPEQTLQILEITTGKALREPLTVPVSHSGGMRLHPQGRTVIYPRSRYSFEFVVEDAKSGEEVGSFNITGSNFEATKTLLFTKDGRYLLHQVGRKVTVRDGLNGTLRHELTVAPQDGLIRRVDYSSESQRLSVTTINDGERPARWEWDLNDRRLVRTIQHGESAQPGLRYQLSPDRRYIVSATNGTAILLWKLTDNDEPFTLPHIEAVQAAAFSNDGRVLATAAGKTISLWNTSTGMQHAPSLELPGTVTSIKLSEDGTRLAVVLDETKFKLWNLSTHQWSGSEIVAMAKLSINPYWEEGRIVLAEPGSTPGRNTKKRHWVIDVESGKNLAEFPDTFACRPIPGGTHVIVRRPGENKSRPRFGSDISHVWNLKENRSERQWTGELLACMHDGTGLVSEAFTKKSQENLKDGGVRTSTKSLGRYDVVEIVTGKVLVSELLVESTWTSNYGRTATDATSRYFAQLSSNELIIYDTNTRELRRLTTDGTVTRPKFEAGGKLVRVVGRNLTDGNSELWFWNTNDGSFLGRFPVEFIRPEDARNSSVPYDQSAVSSDGRYLFAGRIHDLQTGRALGGVMADDQATWSAAFVGNDRSVLTYHSKEGYREWQVPRPHSDSPVEIESHIQRLTRAQLDDENDMHTLSLQHWRRLPVGMAADPRP